MTNSAIAIRAAAIPRRLRMPADSQAHRPAMTPAPATAAADREEISAAAAEEILGAVAAEEILAAVAMQAEAAMEEPAETSNSAFRTSLGAMLMYA